MDGKIERLVEQTRGHTPGPWTFDGPPSSRIVWAGTEHRICFLTSDGPNLANAHLIAEAPTMLATIQSLSERIAVLEGALEPFTRGPDGTSLARLYAHLNREHYRNAVASLTQESGK